MTVRGQEFQPDWASAPGDTIVDILRERHLTEAEFAVRIGQSLQYVEDLLRGHATITITVARNLARVLGASTEFWMSRDFQYRNDISRLNPSQEEWVRELPVGDMIRFGWLSPVPHPSEEASSCLRFFDVPDVSTWRRTYANVAEQVAFRTSKSFDSRPGAVAAWLRRGEVEGERISCGPWSPVALKNVLLEIRPLTRQKNPRVFIPRLQSLCASAGVAVAIVHAPSGCRASGATRFLSPAKALVLLSFRYLADDQFWFSVFHELGHLLLHGEKLRSESGLFLEGLDGPSSQDEEEADRFAAEQLVPAEFEQRLLRLSLDSRKIIRFGRELKIAPGIVVGQLQYRKRIKPNQLNSLKRRFKWED